MLASAFSALSLDSTHVTDTHLTRLTPLTRQSQTSARMATTSAAAQDVVQHLIDAISGPALPTHAPVQLEAFRAELQRLLDRLQAYHWSAHFPIQAKRIYGTGTHNLNNVVTSFFVDHPIIEPARAYAWTQFETVMDRYVNAGHGTATTGAWMEGLMVREYDTDINNDQLEALVVCLLAVKEDVDWACEAVGRAGSREWWVVPSPMAHFGTSLFPSTALPCTDTADVPQRPTPPPPASGSSSLKTDPAIPWRSGPLLNPVAYTTQRIRPCQRASVRRSPRWPNWVSHRIPVSGSPSVPDD